MNSAGCERTDASIEDGHDDQPLLPECDRGKQHLRRQRYLAGAPDAGGQDGKRTLYPKHCQLP